MPSQPKPSQGLQTEGITTQITEVIIRYTTTRRIDATREEDRHYIARVNPEKAGGVVWQTGGLKDRNHIPADADWLDIQEDKNPPPKRHKPRLEEGLCYYVRGGYYCA